MNKVSDLKPVVFLLLSLAFLNPAPSLAAEPDNKTAILPFEVHAAEDLAYLRSGIRDMLASRLAAGAGVKIVNKAAVDAALAQGQTPAPAQFQALSEQIGADYLVTGSFTSLGGGASIDAKVYAVQTRTTQDFYVTAPRQDEVIMAINTLAWEIGEKIFGKARPVQATQAPASAPAAVAPPAASYQTAHPERAFFGNDGSGSPFIRPQGVTGAFGFTKSQNFSMSLQAMDVGDVDGDGVDDVVLADRDKVQVFRIEDGRFGLLGEAQAAPGYKIHYVSLADLNGNGKAEIYVSTNDNITPSSFGLEWQADSLQKIFTEQRYYLRALVSPGNAPILAGQQNAFDYPFEPGIFEMAVTDGNLRPANEIVVPKQTNIFDFALADLDGDGRQEVISIDQSDIIRIARPSGKMLWKSDDYYGGTKRYVGEAEKELRSDRLHEAARYYIPSRLLVLDLNHDQRLDLVVNKNLSTASRVFRNLKSYPSGEIHGLAWNGIGLTELWHTRKIDGYIADYQLRMLDEAGKAILYVGVVLNSGLSEALEGNDSTVLMYPLDLGAVTK